MLAVLWAGLVLTFSQSSLRRAARSGSRCSPALRWSPRGAWAAARGGAGRVGAAFVLVAPRRARPRPRRLGVGRTTRRAGATTSSRAACGCSPTSRSRATARARSRASTAAPRTRSAERAVSASHTIPVTVAAEQGVGRAAALPRAARRWRFWRLLRGARGDPARAARRRGVRRARRCTRCTYAAFLEDPLTWALLGVGAGARAAAADAAQRREPHRAGAGAELRVVGALALAALLAWALVPTYPNYDAYYHLVWGRELLDGDAPSLRGLRGADRSTRCTSRCGAVLGLVGDGRRPAARAVRRRSATSRSCWGVFRLGARGARDRRPGVVGGAASPARRSRCCSTPRAPTSTCRSSRSCSGPRRSRPSDGRDAAARRRPLALLAVAGLLRPEAWVLAGLLLAVAAVARPLRAAARSPRSRRVVLGARRPRASPATRCSRCTRRRELADELGRAARPRRGARRRSSRFLGDTAREPVAALGGRRRSCWPGAGASARALHVPLALLRRGRADVRRRPASPGSRSCRATSRSRRSRSACSPATRRRLHGAAPAALVVAVGRRWPAVAVGVVAVPTRLDRLDDRAALHPRDPRRPRRGARTTRGRARRARCGPVTLPNYRLVPDARWILDAAARRRSARARRGDRDRGVALVFTGEKALRRYGRADGASPRDERPAGGLPRDRAPRRLHRLRRC